MPRQSITLNRPRAEVEQRWHSSDPEHPHADEVHANARFVEAPGDRGTEIHLEFEQPSRAGRLGEAVQKLRGSEPEAKVKDDLRRFKQILEAGVIARSDATPDGESLGRKLHQEPAQPAERDLQEVQG